MCSSVTALWGSDLWSLNAACVERKQWVMPPTPTHPPLSKQTWHKHIVNKDDFRHSSFHGWVSYTGRFTGKQKVPWIPRLNTWSVSIAGFFLCIDLKSLLQTSPQLAGRQSLGEMLLPRGEAGLAAVRVVFSKAPGQCLVTTWLCQQQPLKTFLAIWQCLCSRGCGSALALPSLMRRIMFTFTGVWSG